MGFRGAVVVFFSPLNFFRMLLVQANVFWVFFKHKQIVKSYMQKLYAIVYIPDVWTTPRPPFYSFISTSANVCLVAPGARIHCLFFFTGGEQAFSPLLPHSISTCHVVGN